MHLHILNAHIYICVKEFNFHPFLNTLPTTPTTNIMDLNLEALGVYKHFEILCRKLV